MVHLQKGQSTKHHGEVATVWTSMEPSGSGLLPGDLEHPEEPFPHSLSTVSPQACTRMLNQNEAGGRFSRERKKGVSGTMAQIVWKGVEPNWSSP